MKTFTLWTALAVLTLSIPAGAQMRHQGRSRPAGTTRAGATRDQGASGATATLTHNLIVNGRPVGGDVAPTVLNGTVMVPIRFMTQYLGGTVDYAAKGQRVELSRGQHRTIVLNIGSTQATMNGEGRALSQAPVVLHGRTFIPLREVGRFFDAQVQYTPDTHTVSVTLPENGTSPAGGT